MLIRRVSTSIVMPAAYIVTTLKKLGSFSGPLDTPLLIRRFNRVKGRCRSVGFRDRDK